MGVHAYKSVDSKQYYRSLDALVTGARVRLNNVESWFRARPPFQRGVAVGLAAGLLIAFVVRYLLFQVNAAYLKGFELQTGFPEQCSLGVTRTEKGTEAKNDLAWDSPLASIDKSVLILKENELEGQLEEERDMLRQALQKAVDKVREAEQRASRAIEHANQQMHATAQRAIEMQGEVNHHVNRAHAAQREAEMHQKNSLTHQAIAAQHAASLQETSQHLSALRSELEKVEEAEAAWEKFHRAAIEKTIKHGDHKAFPHMILNAGQAPSNGYRVGQKAAVQLSQGGKASKPRREMLR